MPSLWSIYVLVIIFSLSDMCFICSDDCAFVFFFFFFFKQKTAYEMRISDWSSDVCSSDLIFHRTPCVRPDAPFDPASPRRLMRPDHIAVPEPCEHDSCFVRLWQGRVYQPDRPIAAHPRRNSVRAFVGPFRSASWAYHA